MDDNAGVVGTGAVVAGGEEPLSILVDRHWRELGGLGVERGEPALVDLWKTMWVFEQGERGVDEEGEEELRRAMGRIEGVYSGEAVRPAAVLERAPRVAVLNNGFAGGAEALLERMGLVYAVIDPLFDPEKALAHDVLLVPSGGLYGMGESEGLRERLRAYVEGGGTLIVMAQMRGEDFGAVPVPEGEALEVMGWLEDQSCWWGSLVQAARHPALASVRGGSVPEPVDGSIVRWPAGSVVLLRRASGGAPALVEYGLGSGRVVVGTLYGDWAEANGGEPMDGYRVLRDLVLWGMDPEMERPVCRVGTPCSPEMPVTVRNVGGEDADRVVWEVRELWPASESWTGSETLELPAGESAAVTVRPRLGQAGGSSQWPGLLPLRYRLEDSERTLHETWTVAPWLVQPWAMAGQLLLVDWPSEVDTLPQVGVTLTTPQEDWPENAVAPVHLAVMATGDAPVSGTVAIDFTPGPAAWGFWRRQRTVTFTALPGTPYTADLQVGPLELIVGHGGNAGGGTLRAQVFVPGDDEPAVAAFRSVLRNRRQMAVALSAAPERAAPGDEVVLSATLTNQTMAAFSGRYRIVVRNEYNVLGTPQQRTIRFPWQPFSVEVGGGFSLEEPFTVPADWQGRGDVFLYFCYPYQECWEDGSEYHASERPARTRFEMPLAGANVSIGQPAVVSGPALRVPVTVRNPSPRPLANGRLDVWLEREGSHRTFGPFTIPGDGSAAFSADLPFGGNGSWPRTFSLRAGTSQDGVPAVGKRASRSVRYGFDLRVTESPRVLDGAQEGALGLEIVNPGSLPVSLELRVDVPDVGFHEVRTLPLPAGQRIGQSFTIPVPESLGYGWHEVVATLSDGVSSRSRSTLLAHPEPRPPLAVRTAGVRPVAGGTVTVEVEWGEATVAVPVQGTLEVAVPDLGFAESRAVTLAADQGGLERFTVALGSDLEPGDYPVRVHLAGPNGGGEVRETSFFLSSPEPVIERTGADPVAGGGLTYRVTNIGGTEGHWAWVWILRSGGVELASRELSMTVGPGQSEELTMDLPEGLATGRYTASIWVGSAWLSEGVDVTGTTATLSVATSQEVYRPWERIDGTAVVGAGPAGLAGAAVHLEVVDAHRRVKPWGVYQGTGERNGVSAGTGPADFSAVTWFGGESGIRSAVAGDLDGDGYDDLVGVTDPDGGVRAPDGLMVFRGPWMDPGPGFPLDPGVEAATAGVEDTDGDGAPEVYLWTAAPGGVTVRRLGPGLGEVWSRDLPGPAREALASDGGPVFADLDGDGVEEVIVTSDGAVSALRTQDGTVLWAVAGTPAFPDGAVVTGTAVGEVDGSPRVLVALATTDGGELVALDGGGGVVWGTALTAPPAGCPVRFGTADAPRAAVVATPGDSSESSILTVVDAADGVVRGSSGVWFRSSWPVAAGDVDGDGTAELVVACESGVLAFEATGALLWDASTPMGALGPPALLDCDGDDLPDVIASSGDEWFGELRIFRGTDGSSVAGPSEGTGPLTVLDAGGDWKAELFAVAPTGGGVVYGLDGGDPGVRAVDRRKVLWSWDGNVDVAAQATMALHHVLDTGSELGQFLFRGRVRNAMGQLLAQAQTPFSVEDEVAEIVLDPVPVSRPGASVTVAGRVGLQPGPKAELSVELEVDGVAAGERTVNVDPGGTAPFSFGITAPGPGDHAVRVRVRDGSEVIGTAGRLLEVQVPEARVSVKAPERTGSRPFPVEVEIVNPTGLEEHLTVQLLPGDEAPRSLDLAPHGSRTELFERTVAEDTELVAVLSGDVQTRTAASVDFDAETVLVPPQGGDLPVGDRVLGATVRNTGTRWFEGELTWRVDGSGTGSGVVPLSLAGGESRDLDLEIVLTGGPARLILDLAGHHEEVALNGYDGGIGTLGFDVVSPAAVGEVPVEVTVRNTASFDGRFLVELDAVDDTGAVVGHVVDSWTVGAGEDRPGTLWLDLPEGSFTIRGRLNGLDAGSRRVTVLPARRVEAEAGIAAPDADGISTLEVTVSNEGAAPAWVVTTVEGPTGPETFDGEIAPGETRVDTVALRADEALDGILSAHVSVGDGGDGIDLERDVSLELAPGRLEVVSAPSLVEAAAGGQAVVPVELRNTGWRPASYEIQVELAEGGAGRAVSRGELPGGATVAVPVAVAVPGDVPTSTVEGRYWVMSNADGGGGGEAAAGFFPVRIRGLDLDVTASLDRDHAASGESVTLSLTVSAPAAAAPVELALRVGYGSFSSDQPVTVGPAPRSIDVEVPVDRSGGDLRFGFFWPSGRAAYLDQRTVHSSEGPVVLSTDRETYLPGQTMQVTAAIPEGSSLEVAAPWGVLVFEGSGTQSLEIPEGTPYGRYPLLWTLVGGPEGEGNGTYDIRVRGPHVRILHVEVPQEVQAGVTVSAAVTVASDSDVDVVLRPWIVAPGGGSDVAADVPLLLVAEDLRRVSVPFTAPGRGAGTYRLVVEAVDPAERTLSTAQAFFDMGGAAVLGISTDRPAYLAGDPVTALVTVSGSGTGGLTVRLDGDTVHQGTVTLSGVESVTVPLGPAAGGEHTVEAELAAGGTVSRAVTAFEGATEPLRITAEGVIDGGVVGRPYIRTLEAVGGVAPYSWELANGELPPDLVLDPAGGTLQGTLSRTGTWVGVVRVLDAGGREATAGIRITVAASPLEIVTETLPAAVAGSSYAVTLEAEGGTTPHLWHVTDGALPEGLVLHGASGVIGGVPEEPGAALFTVEVLDGGGLSSERAFELVVNERAPGIPATRGVGNVLLIVLLAGAALVFLNLRSPTGGP